MSDLAADWSAAWPRALAVWGPFTKLRPPRLCSNDAEARGEGLTGSFAMIRLVDQAVVVNLAEVARAGVADFALEVLAHEIGHHVLAPATLTDHGRMIARMRFALPTLEARAPMVANLYTDLFINDRLRRSAGLRMAELYRALSRAETGAGGRLWRLYLRIYELLWGLARGHLGGGSLAGDDQAEGDAWLGARLLRSYARDQLGGAGRFAALLLPYLLDDAAAERTLARLFDTRDAAAGGDPAGLSEGDPDEQTGAIHPAADPALNDALEDDSETAEVADAPARPRSGQTRQPFEYGEILRAAGVLVDDHEVAVRYYRERALPFRVPYPRRPSPRAQDPLPEGLEPWDIGHPLDAIDWLASVLQSPRVLPGMTTVQRVWGFSEGTAPACEPIDLDLYIDSSGSMLDPRRWLSFPTLAGAIICLSALRAGAAVQATLWSGKREWTSTAGFVRDERAVLRVLTGYFGGATAFPIHVLRDTFARRRPDARPVHVLNISDDGASTMFDDDERGTSGWEVAASALARGRAGGTLVLNLPEDWDDPTRWASDPLRVLQRARDEQGWAIHRVASWGDVIEFARAFSHRRFGAIMSER